MADDLAIVGVGEVVVRGREPDGPAEGEHGPAVALAEQVHRGSVEVSHGVVHPTHAVPSLPDLEEGVLHQLLRLGAVPGHEPQPPEQGPSLGLVEDLEGARRRELVEGRVRDDDRFGHAVCMNPRNGPSVQVGERAGRTGCTRTTVRRRCAPKIDEVRY